MSERRPCTGCGIPVPGADLTVSGEAALCPRCFALAAPATLTGTRKRVARPGPGGAGRGTGPERRERADPSASPGAWAGGLAALAARIEASVREWVGGRLWWARAPIVAWLAWILARSWDAPGRTTLWSGIDLAVHEIGHILWSPLGEFMGMAGGTLTQLLVPVAAGAMLYRQRDWFGVSVAVSWLGINCFEISEYAGDALARRLPLVSPMTADPIHDWSYMLGQLGLLRHTAAVAGAWLWSGRLLLAGGVAFGVWVLWIMARTPAPLPVAETRMGPATGPGPELP